MAVNQVLQYVTRNAVSIVLTTLLAYVAYYVIYFIVRIIRLKRKFRDFPCPKERQHWLWGHLGLLQNITGKDRLLLGIEFTKRFPKVYILWIGPWVNCVLNHPETLKVVLKGADPKPTGFGGVYRHALPWLGEGLLIAGGKRWARSRRLLTPAFHFNILKPYIAVYNDCADQFACNIRKYVDSGNSFEAFNLVCLCTLDIILRCAFSYQTNCQKNSGEVHPYVKAVNQISATWSKRNRSPWLYPDFIFYMTKTGKEFTKNCHYVHEVAEEVIETRRNTLKTQDISSRKYLDFLDILLTATDEDGKGLTKTEIRSEVDTFLFEGHDTTASAISWILYSLAEHPEYQSQCQREIDMVLEMSGKSEIQWDDLGKLEFLTQCIKEGMRLHVPVPFIARVTTKDVVVDGHTLPSGCMVSCHLWNLHHNPAVWKDPMEFKPERFEKENMQEMDSFAFLPFSAGPRNCIGQNFAMNEEKVVLAKVLSQFTFSLDPNHVTEKTPAAVMRAKDGIRLLVKSRNDKTTTLTPEV